MLPHGEGEKGEKDLFLQATASPLPAKTPLFLGQNPTFYAARLSVELPFTALT